MIVKYGKLTFDIHPSENHKTVLDLKRIAASEVGVEVESVRLVVSGKILEDHSIFRDILQTNAKISMVACNRISQTPMKLPIVRNDFVSMPTIRKHPNKMKKETPKFCFGTIQTLPGLPMEPKARQILEELATDPGVLAVMEKYKWNVGTLAELFPEGEVGVSEVLTLALVPL